MKSRILETERLFLRELECGRDAAFMLKLLNDPDFIKNIGDKGARTLADADQYILLRAQASYKKNGYGLYLMELKSSNIPIGICGLVKREDLEFADVGFAILPEFRKQGYVLEASREVLSFAHKTLKHTTILGVTSSSNASSIGVLTALGLKYVGDITLEGYTDTSKLFQIDF